MVLLCNGPCSYTVLPGKVCDSDATLRNAHRHCLIPHTLSSPSSHWCGQLECTGKLMQKRGAWQPRSQCDWMEQSFSHSLLTGGWFLSKKVCHCSKSQRCQWFPALLARITSTNIAFVSWFSCITSTQGTQSLVKSWSRNSCLSVVTVLEGHKGGVYVVRDIRCHPRVVFVLCWLREGLCVLFVSSPAVLCGCTQASFSVCQVHKAKTGHSPWQTYRTSTMA